MESNGKFKRDWEEMPLEDTLAKLLDFRGRTPKKLGMNWGGGSIPALSANNVVMGGIDFSKETYLGSDELYDKWMTQGHTCKGDILLTLEAPLGNVARIPDGKRYLLSQRVVLLKPDSRKVNPDFLYHLLISDEFQRRLIKESTGTTATGIRQTYLRNIPV